MSPQTERTPALTDAPIEPTRAETSSVQLPGRVNPASRALRDIWPIIEATAIGAAGVLMALASH